MITYGSDRAMKTGVPQPETFTIYAKFHIATQTLDRTIPVY